MSTWADAIDESQKQWKKRKAEQEPDNALPCGHDQLRFLVQDDPNNPDAVHCLLCEEIGEERERCARIAEWTIGMLDKSDPIGSHSRNIAAAIRRGRPEGARKVGGGMTSDLEMRQSFVIPVEPTAKARPRVVRLKNGASHTYTGDKTVDAEERIRWHLRAKKAVCYPAGTPLSVDVAFVVKRPASKKKAIWPVSRPDLDQFVKLLLDAGNGLLWEDDACIVKVAARKCYTSGEPEIILGVEKAF